MKQLMVRALALVLTCGFATMAQEKPGAPTATAKAAPTNPTGSEKVTKTSAKVKAETRHKAFLEGRKAAEADRKNVDAHLRKMRRDWALQAEKEKLAHKERKEKNRTPGHVDKTKQDKEGTPVGSGEEKKDPPAK